MATEINTTVQNYLRLPIADTPSNQPYQTHEEAQDESGVRDEAKRAFLDLHATSRWPEVDFPRLNTDQLGAYRSMLLGLIDDIEDAPADTSNESKDMTYDALIQKLHEIDRHLTVARRLGDTSAAAWLSDKLPEELRLRAAEQNLAIFGRPEIGRFNWFLARDQRLAQAKLTDPNPLVRLKAQEFLDRTTTVEAGEAGAPIELDTETRTQLKADLFAIFLGLEEFCHQGFPDTLRVDDVLPYFNRMRDILGLPSDQYEARFSNKRASEEMPWGVAVGKKRTTPFSGKDIIRVSFHEWTHVLRRHNARLQPDAAKQLPTPSNLAFEEALCVLFERTLVDESYVAGVNYYKAIGLQMGLDTTQDTHNLSTMRDFREVVDIMALADGLRVAAQTDQDFAKAEARVYNHVMRTSRGNALDARDLSYHTGDQRAKQAVLNIHDLPADQRQAAIKWYLSGQFDPTEPYDAQQFATVEIQEK